MIIVIIIAIYIIITIISIIIIYTTIILRLCPSNILLFTIAENN